MAFCGKTALVLSLFCIPMACHAENPFSDVPAGHWAYESVGKLVSAGILEGYGDGTFRGDRLITRYEMARMVAQAMAKGANVDRLASEFGEELETLGVRVGNLEKRTDNVRITGEVRAHFASLGGAVRTPKYLNCNRLEEIRSRIAFNGRVNDGWEYVGGIENIQYLDEDKPVGDEQTRFREAYLKGRVGGVRLTAGRFNLVRDTEGNVYDDQFDGLKFSYGNKYRIGGYYGRPSVSRARETAVALLSDGGWRKAYGLDFSASLGKSFGLSLGFDKFSDSSKGFDDNFVYDVGLRYSVGKFGIGGNYYKSDSESARNKDGFSCSVSYGRVDPRKPGSWDIGYSYYRLGDGVNIANGMDGPSEFFTEGFKNVSGGGFKGSRVAFHYALSRNIVFGSQYFDLKGIDVHSFGAKSFWNELKFYF